ncbi:hypothetical protein CEB3_c04740 [Peptococcaceae bacterium CEB3]|nr:hypothetical protein CEB3_c04740 [Peptococcaceae bacterium CEB3]
MIENGLGTSTIAEEKGDATWGIVRTLLTTSL